MTEIISKAERLDVANAVLLAIARHGRRFFWSERRQRAARFALDRLGRVRLTDDYTGVPVLVSRRSQWRGFSHGGTLRALVEAMAGYIRTGEPITGRYFGPWPDWICDGDLWGYGAEAMKALRADLAGSPAIVWRTPAPPPVVNAAQAGA